MGFIFFDNCFRLTANILIKNAKTKKFLLNLDGALCFQTKTFES